MFFSKLFFSSKLWSTKMYLKFCIFFLVPAIKATEKNIKMLMSLVTSFSPEFTITITIQKCFQQCTIYFLLCLFFGASVLACHECRVYQHCQSSPGWCSVTLRLPVLKLLTKSSVSNLGRKGKKCLGEHYHLCMEDNDNRWVGTAFTQIKKP